MTKASTARTLTVTLGVCLVCSIFVAVSAVSLKPRQDRNRERERLKNILLAGGVPHTDADLDQVFRTSIRPFFIDLERGERIGEPPFDPVSFDFLAAVKNPALSIPIPKERDAAGIGRRPRYMPAYGVMKGDTLLRIVLPLFGKGLWSTMVGLIALDRDLVTIRGLTFYEHGETPGLGGEVDNPGWKRLWVGKRAYGDDFSVRIRVVKGTVSDEDPEALYRIDGLSGATLTTRGVDGLVRFWLGDLGYRPFLMRLASEAGPSP